MLNSYHPQHTSTHDQNSESNSDSNCSASRGQILHLALVPHSAGAILVCGHCACDGGADLEAGTRAQSTTQRQSILQTLLKKIENGKPQSPEVKNRETRYTHGNFPLIPQNLLGTPLALRRAQATPSCRTRIPVKPQIAKPTLFAGQVAEFLLPGLASAPEARIWGLELRIFGFRRLGLRVESFGFMSCRARACDSGLVEGSVWG